MKKVVWVASAKKRLKEFPKSVQKDIGDALFIAQKGGMSSDAIPFKHVGSGVFEIRVTHRTDTYRSVYSVKIGERIYVLHCFQKKSKKGKNSTERDRFNQRTSENSTRIGEKL